MADYYIGEIRLLAFNNLIPRDFAACNGQTLSITGHEALYAIIGTTYGGDGIKNFGLPNLIGRVPLGVGQGPGLNNYTVGQAVGVDTVTLGVSNIPTHIHTVSTSKQSASAMSPGPTVVQGAVSNSNVFYANAQQPGTQQIFAPDTIAASTNSLAIPQAHLNVQPTMGLVYVICINGLFPINN